MSNTQAIELPPANAEDASHLKVLSIVYYVFAALDLISIVFIGFYALMMRSVFSANPIPQNQNSAPPDAFIGILMAFCAIAVVLTVVASVTHFMTARRLTERRGMMFCQIIAGLTCLSFPLGTVLGVFTFIVLGRPSVKALFAARS
ncbi:MAG: hypothetical protein ACREP7_09300 [Lysobacter sp.]